MPAMDSQRTPRGHRTAELRSIAMHRLIAERLNDKILDQARQRLDWLADENHIHPHWEAKWRELIDLPCSQIRVLLVEDSQHMRDMRQSTPFAGVLSEEERWTIIQEVH